MKIFNSVGHLFAWIVGKAIPAATKGVQAVEGAIDSPLAGLVASALGPKAEKYQSGIQAIAGDVLAAFGDAGAAIGAAGLNVQFDEATVTAIRAIYADIKALKGGSTAAA